MINEERTLKDFGYTSDDLTFGMTRKVWAICNMCGFERLIRYDSCLKANGKCNACSQKGKHHSDEHKLKISIAVSGKNHPNYGIHFSEEFKQILSDAHKGKMCGADNPNYNPNLTDEERIYKRDTIQNTQWTLSIKKRDDFICQKCHVRGGNIIAHHIFGYSVYVNARYDIDNGITLCKNCHAEFHHLYGYKYFTDNDFFEWVTSNE